jgi:hypothetical protein
MMNSGNKGRRDLSWWLAGPAVTGWMLSRRS